MARDDDRRASRVYKPTKGEVIFSFHRPVSTKYLIRWWAEVSSSDPFTKSKLTLPQDGLVALDL